MELQDGASLVEMVKLEGMLADPALDLEDWQVRQALERPDAFTEWDGHLLLNKQAQGVQAVLDGEIDTLINVGSVGSGKSYLAAILTMEHAKRQTRPRRYLAVSQSQASIESRMVPLFETWAERTGVKLKYARGSGAARPTMTFNKHKVEAHGGEKKTSFSSMKGDTDAGVIYEEASVLHYSVWNEGLGRIRGAYDPFISITTNAGSPNCWVKRLIDTKSTEKGVLYLEHTWQDNPLVPDNFYERQVRLKSPQAVRRDLYNEWLADEQLVYEHWYESDVNPDTYIDMGIVRNMPYKLSADYGFAGTTAVLQWKQVDGDNWVITDEYYHDAEIYGQLGASEHAVKIMKQFPNSLSVAIDPRAGELARALRKMGNRVIEADADRHEGLDRTQYMLSNGVIKIGNAPNLKREIKGYCFVEGTDRTNDEYDHACDALRYGAMTYTRIGKTVYRAGAPA